MNYMHLAAQAAIKEMRQHKGGPFGAVLIKNGEVIATSGNSVVADCDPTAHAELLVIRKSAQILKTLDLSDCVLYATCNLCPMCVAAALWVGIKTIYYASSHEEASKNGFSAKHLDNYFNGIDTTLLQIKQIDSNEAYSYIWKIYQELNEVHD